MTTKQLLIMCLLLLTACSSQENITNTPTTCAGYVITSAIQPNCIQESNYTIIQTPLNKQVQFEGNSFEITLIGTALFYPQKIISLEGSITLGSKSKVQTIREGQEISIGDDLLRISPYVLDDLQGVTLDRLQRKFDLVQPTATAIITPTPDIDCPRPEGWTGIYIVQAGDSLTSIANTANITLEDLQAVNCIENANSIQVGQILSVPANSIPATQPAQTFTPSAVFFRADRESLNAGNCTILRWDVQNIRQLQLDNAVLIDETSREVCPDETTTYTLTVDYFDDRQTQHTVTIEVTES